MCNRIQLFGPSHFMKPEPKNMCIVRRQYNEYSSVDILRFIVKLILADEKQFYETFPRYRNARYYMRDSRVSHPRCQKTPGMQCGSLLREITPDMKKTLHSSKYHFM